jgi:hypothetical protein
MWVENIKKRAAVNIIIKTSGCIKYWEVLDKMYSWYLLKKCSTSFSWKHYTVIFRLCITVSHCQHTTSGKQENITLETVDFSIWWRL